jgi:hypothetical protein
MGNEAVSEVTTPCPNRLCPVVEDATITQRLNYFFRPLVTSHVDDAGHHPAAKPTLLRKSHHGFLLSMWPASPVISHGQVYKAHLPAGKCLEHITLAQRGRQVGVKACFVSKGEKS